ncbi:RAQPRD family integrative conjugative element protein [Hyphococcus luteus]|uniref:Conjugal transfer protein n=1 Tax=Hyphococcus luteus TaxID=2058213 RepID=A0A2S7K017_9PROT|nr:RAQPRD family integrative conjugative element protein [Marinicaulis flavus]PQA85863.1 conjugal transfer protein [Marinicaulis flavus]
MMRGIRAVIASGLVLAAAPLRAEEMPTPDSAAAQRSAEAEREALARALQEFQAIERLIADAEARRLSGARIYFDYDALRAELTQVKLGIRQYLDERRPQPRTFEPLEASYVVVDPAQ